MHVDVLCYHNVSTARNTLARLAFLAFPLHPAAASGSVLDALGAHGELRRPRPIPH